MRPLLSKADIGEAARQMISARLMLAGFSVFRPFERRHASRSVDPARLLRIEVPVQADLRTAQRQSCDEPVLGAQVGTKREGCEASIHRRRGRLLHRVLRRR